MLANPAEKVYCVWLCAVDTQGTVGLSQVLSLDEAIVRREMLRWSDQTLVFTNGHFDLLHIGHLDYLERASKLGDVLFVGINGDGSTAQLKGTGRPIIPAAERARIIAALKPVAAAIIFDEPTAVTLIKKLQPEIYVKGGDYGYRDEEDLLILNKPLPEQNPVESYGGRIELIDFLPDHSTTGLIDRIKALP